MLLMAAAASPVVPAAGLAGPPYLPATVASDSFDPTPATASNSFYLPVASGESGETTPQPERLLSRDFVKLAFRDVGHVFTAPARWDRRDWRNAGLVTLGLVTVVAVVDEPFRDAWDGEFEEDPDDFLRKFEPFGTKQVTAPTYLAFYLAGLATDDARAQSVALDGFIAGQIANTLLTRNLKRIFGRARPYQELGADHFDPGSEDRSFPSGHATHAFTAATVIATHYDDKPWVKGVCYGLATLVAAERIEHDEHWLSDVLAGALIGTFVGKQVVSFNRVQREKNRLTFGTDGRMLTATWAFD